MELAIKEQTRFDTRLPKEQKQFFEKAAILGGYRSLTDFIIQAVQEKAKEIIRDREQILVSERDNEIFFNAIINPQGPNDSLREAANKYNAYFSE